MSKPTATPLTIAEGILQFLSDGEKHISEIKAHVDGKPGSITQTVYRLTQASEIEKCGKGYYRLPSPDKPLIAAPPVTENLRGEAENTETINRMLNLYDKLLDAVARSVEAEDWDGIVDKIETIKSLRWLGATVDQLMKRWYLVHRGYDNNTKQAHEDAKQKTADLEEQKVAQLPPEKRIKVIRSYDVTMQELIERLPGKVDHKV